MVQVGQRVAAGKGGQHAAVQQHSEALVLEQQAGAAHLAASAQGREQQGVLLHGAVASSGALHGGVKQRAAVGSTSTRGGGGVGCFGTGLAQFFNHASPWTSTKKLSKIITLVFVFVFRRQQHTTRNAVNAVRRRLWRCQRWWQGRQWWWRSSWWRPWQSQAQGWKKQEKGRRRRSAGRRRRRPRAGPRGRCCLRAGRRRPQRPPCHCARSGPGAPGAHFRQPLAAPCGARAVLLARLRRAARQGARAARAAGRARHWRRQGGYSRYSRWWWWRRRRRRQWPHLHAFRAAASGAAAQFLARPPSPHDHGHAPSVLWTGLLENIACTVLGLLSPPPLPHTRSGTAME